MQPFRRIESLKEVVPAVSVRLAAVAAVGFMLFAAAASIMMLDTNLMLIE